jgi:hypothetical protein
MERLLPFRIKAAIDGRPVLTRQRLLVASATAELCDIRTASTPQNDESSWFRNRPLHKSDLFGRLAIDHVAAKNDALCGRHLHDVRRAA